MLSALVTAACFLVILSPSRDAEWPLNNMIVKIRGGVGLVENGVGRGTGAVQGAADPALWGRTSGFASVEDHATFRTISHEEVRKYWDERPCNSGWRFDGVEWGSRCDPAPRCGLVARAVGIISGA